MALASTISDTNPRALTKLKKYPPEVKGHAFERAMSILKTESSASKGEIAGTLSYYYQSLLEGREIPISDLRTIYETSIGRRNNDLREEILQRDPMAHSIFSRTTKKAQ